MHLIHLIFSQKYQLRSYPAVPQFQLECGFSLVFFWGDLLNSKQAMVQPPWKKMTETSSKSTWKNMGWRIIRIWEPAYLGKTRDSPRYTKQPAPKWSANYSPIPRFLVPEVCFFEFKVPPVATVCRLNWLSLSFGRIHKSSKLWKSNKHITQLYLLGNISLWCTKRARSLNSSWIWDILGKPPRPHNLEELKHIS